MDTAQILIAFKLVLSSEFFLDEEDERREQQKIRVKDYVLDLLIPT